MGKGTGGRLGSTVFCLFWTAIPAVMLVLMARQIARDVGPWSWKPATCTILESGVGDLRPDDNYPLTVRYAYDAGASSAVEAPARIGTVYSERYRGDPDYTKAARLALRYAPGTHATCYVDPSNPNRAVLKQDIPLVALLSPIPLLFAALGLGGLWFTWRPSRPGKGAAPISSADSGRAAVRGGRGMAVLGGLVFLVGAAVAAAMGAKILRVPAARSWTPVAATVLSSNLRHHHGDDSTTYSVNILYSYRVNGKEFRSNRYGFMNGSSSSQGAKQAILDRYRRGTHFTAYVNPADPLDAVIERGFTSDMLVGLVPLAFMGIGGALAYAGRRKARRASPVLENAQGSIPRSAAPLAGRFVPTSRLAGLRAPLSPRQSPGLKLLGVSILALFWNGIVSVFAYQVVKGWTGGHGPVCLTVFILPFLAFGVALLAAMVYYLLAVFNPRCELTLQPPDLRLGEAVELRWSFTGRADRIHRLVVLVEGREEATYRQGTDTRTDKNVFHVEQLLETSRPLDIRAGKARWQIPAGTMHSFDAAHNRILWVVCIHGYIAGWPDVKDEYLLTVAPLPAEKLPKLQPATAGATDGARVEGVSWT